MKIFLTILLLPLFLLAETTPLEYEYHVIKGTCTVKVRGQNNGSKKNKNNEYVMSPLKLEKEKYSDEFLKKAFEDYLDGKHKLSKTALGTAKKFTDKSEADKYVRSLLKKRAKRTYMTESHVTRYFAKHGDKTGEKNRKDKEKKASESKKKTDKDKK